MNPRVRRQKGVKEFLYKGVWRDWSNLYFALDCGNCVHCGRTVGLIGREKNLLALHKNFSTGVCCQGSGKKGIIRE